MFHKYYFISIEVFDDEGDKIHTASKTLRILVFTSPIKVYAQYVKDMIKKFPDAAIAVTNFNRL